MSAAKLKVLFVCPFAPWPLVNGGKTRTYHLLRAASRHAEIHLHLVREPEQAEDVEAALAPFCASTTIHERSPLSIRDRMTQPKLERWFHSASLIATLAEILSAPAASDFDLVHLDELLLAQVLPRSVPLPVVQHHHKLDTVLYSEIGTGGKLERAFDLWKLKRLEHSSTLRTKSHLLCCQEDADILQQRHGALDIGIVPSGFDPEVFFNTDPAPERSPGHLLYLGSMDYGPNVDGVLWFSEMILPRILETHPDVVLDVVGGNPTPAIKRLASEHILIHGRADQVQPWLAETAAMVVPLRIGGGTRLKIAEALGVGTPTVSTTIGAEGLGLKGGRELALADEPEAFAKRTCELLEAPGTARELGERGRRFALEHFTWDVLGDSLAAYWKRVAGSHRP